MTERRVIAFTADRGSGQPDLGEILRVHIAHVRARERREKLFPLFVVASLFVWLSDVWHGIPSRTAEELVLLLWAMLFAMLMLCRWIEWRWDRRRNRLLCEPPAPPAML
jgi:hypothetical protein